MARQDGGRRGLWLSVQRQQILNLLPRGADPIGIHELKEQGEDYACEDCEDAQSCDRVRRTFRCRRKVGAGTQRSVVGRWLETRVEFGRIGCLHVKSPVQKSRPIVSAEQSYVGES